MKNVSKINNLARKGGGGLLLASIFALSTQTAQAEDLGCTFLLCMGDPNPMSIASCVSPVKKVLKRISKGKGIPVCLSEDGKDVATTGNYVSFKRANPTPDCPAGYRQGADDIAYHAGTKPANARRMPFTGKLNISSGDMSAKFQKDDFMSRLWGDGYKKRVCVKGSNNGSIDAYTSHRRDHEFHSPRQEWFDDVKIMTPDGAKYEFTMFTDGAEFRQHRL